MVLSNPGRSVWRAAYGLHNSRRDCSEERERGVVRNGRLDRENAQTFRFISKRRVRTNSVGQTKVLMVWWDIGDT